MSEGKRVVITGATGMVGGVALHLCLAHDDVVEVTVIGRRSVGLEHPKLLEILHDDLGDCAPLEGALAGRDLALFCVGVYTGAVPDDRFRRITVDYTVEFARALHAASPAAAFCFLSGMGADPEEKSRTAFERYKGMAENALLRTGFPRVHIFRPGYIYPVTPREEPNLMYRVSRVLYPALRPLFPNMGISSGDLARAMVEVGLGGRAGGDDPVLENRDIRQAVQP